MSTAIIIQSSRSTHLPNLTEDPKYPVQCGWIPCVVSELFIIQDLRYNAALHEIGYIDISQYVSLKITK